MSYCVDFPQIDTLPLYFQISVLCLCCIGAVWYCFKTKRHNLSNFVEISSPSTLLRTFCFLHFAKVCTNAILFVTLSFSFSRKREIIFFWYYHWSWNTSQTAFLQPASPNVWTKIKCVIWLSPKNLTLLLYCKWNDSCELGNEVEPWLISCLIIIWMTVNRTKQSLLDCRI